MDVCILGAGSLGSVIGGLVQRAGGHEVTLVTRNAAHVQAIERSGLTMTSDDDRIVARPTAALTCDGLEPHDLVIVLVKSFDTADAIAGADPVIGPSTTLLTLQNGVGCEQIIGDAVGIERVVVGRTMVGGRMLEPGAVEYGVVGRRTVIGELDGARSERIGTIADVLESAGIETTVSDDIAVEMWEKLFVNVATGAWSALTRLPYGELSIHPDVAEAAVATVAEAMTVARALGIEIRTTDPSVPWRRAWEGLPDGFRASMLQSVDRGSRTEVDVMHGAISQAGRRANVPTPVNDTLWAAVKGLERHLELHRRSSADVRH
ncbi:MAG: ketopantoate reductase family protein [Ilumatobacter sp.]|nr:ketopantoate reductase family protein [Ilumatobacter sp.]